MSVGNQHGVSWVSVCMGMIVSWAYKRSKRTGVLSGSGVMACCPSRRWGMRKESWEWSLQQQLYRVPHTWYCLEPPNKILRLTWGVHVPPNICHEVLPIFLLGVESAGGDNLMYVQPFRSTTPGVFSFSKPRFPFPLFSWINSLIACVGDDYYGLSPFPLQRNLLPTLLLLTDFCLLYFPGIKPDCLSALPSFHQPPATPTKADKDLCQPRSRREEED